MWQKTRLPSTDKQCLRLTFIQLCFVLVAPADLSSFSFFGLFNFDFLRITGSNTCVAPLGPISRLSSFLWTTLVVFCEWALYFAAQLLWARRFNRRSLSRLKIPFGRSLVALYLFTFNSVVQGSLRVFDTVRVQFNGEELCLVRSAPAVSCSESSYQVLLALTAIVFIVYTVLIPVLIIHLSKKIYRSKYSSWMTDALSVLFGPYYTAESSHSHTSLWELVRLIFRVMLLCTIVFIVELSSRMAAISQILGIYFVLLLHVQPYKFRQWLIAEEVSIGLLFLLSHLMVWMAPDFSNGEQGLLIVFSVVPSVCFLLWIAQAKFYSFVRVIRHRLKEEQTSLREQNPPLELSRFKSMSLRASESLSSVLEYLHHSDIPARGQDPRLAKPDMELESLSLTGNPLHDASLLEGGAPALNSQWYGLPVSPSASSLSTIPDQPPPPPPPPPSSTQSPTS